MLSLFSILAFPLLAKDNSDQKKIDEYFEVLSFDKVDFTPEGAVCERVALREVDSLYPRENYDVVNSISYNDKGTTIGELDLVVFDKNTKKVEAIAEVKCWTSFKSALKKAKDQRIRFQTFLNRGIVIFDKDDHKYSKDDFKQVKRFFTISQDGGVNQGFDFELSMSLNDLMKLRQKLLDCHLEGRCPRRK